MRIPLRKLAHGLTLATLFSCLIACGQKKYEGLPSTNTGGGSGTVDNSPPPPETWLEHWFEHRQLVKRVYYDSLLALYLDDDVNRGSTTWLTKLIKDTWQYTRKEYNYGYGPSPRLFAVFHADKYGGGHPAYYFDAGHDYRNVIDCGLGGKDAWLNQTWQERNIIIHEIGHIVESASLNTKGSPAFKIWGDSKWCEIYIYDVYKGLGREEEAKKLYDEMMVQTDNFPRAGTQWFKNWFYPIYENYGKTKVLVNFFAMLKAHFPKDASNKFTRDMNWGEFIHFWSGAAGVNLKAQATIAFGWPAEYEAQFTKAQSDFPLVPYTR